MFLTHILYTSPVQNDKSKLRFRDYLRNIAFSHIVQSLSLWPCLYMVDFFIYNVEVLIVWVSQFYCFVNHKSFELDQIHHFISSKIYSLEKGKYNRDFSVFVKNSLQYFPVRAVDQGRGEIILILKSTKLQRIPSLPNSPSTHSICR